MQQDLFTRIKKLQEGPSRAYKLLSGYFLSNPEELPFQTLSSMARRLGTSESTIVRFSRALGYNGYPDLKEEYQKLILKRLSPSKRLHTEFTLGKDADELNDLLEREIKNVQALQANLKRMDFKAFALAILNADRKYVVGLRGSRGCAYLLSHVLKQILPDVFPGLVGDTSLFEGLKSIGSKDAFIVISYPRYTKRAIEALEFAKNRKARTLAITDSELSPAAQIAELAILAPSSSSGFENSFTACAATINVLATYLAQLDRGMSNKMLKEWKESTKALDFVYRLK